MSLVRTVLVSLSCAALLGLDQLHGQYQQPWAGQPIPAKETTGEDQVLIARRADLVVREIAAITGPMRFTIRVENISTGEALKLSNGNSVPFVSAPVLWVIHEGSRNPIFAGGKPDVGQGLELLAETGNPSQLAGSLAGKKGVVAVGADARPVVGEAEGPITPGQKYEFAIEARPGQVLSTAWMFGQSNDLFYSNDRPIALFDASGKPVSGDITVQLSLWDAGTEVNEEPGAGPNQGPRQKTPTAGVPERQGISHVRDRFSYPRTADVLRLTITPVAGAVSTK